MSVLERFKLVELITTRTESVATFVTGNQIKFNSATFVDLGYPAFPCFAFGSNTVAFDGGITSVEIIPRWKTI